MRVLIAASLIFACGVEDAGTRFRIKGYTTADIHAEAGQQTNCRISLRCTLRVSESSPRPEPRHWIDNCLGLRVHATK